MDSRLFGEQLQVGRKAFLSALRRLRPAAFAVLCSVLPVPAQPEAEAPSGPQLLADVVARLPREPLQVQGDMIVRRQRGVVERSFKFDMSLQWGAQPAVAIYTIRDAFGNPLEQMTVRRASGQPPAFEYAAGNPPTAAVLPGLFDAVQETDISWTDLALSFLWWPGGSVIATNEVRGRRCYVVEVPVPAGLDRPAGAAPAAGGRAATPYRSVRLWVDAEIRMLLQAEGLDEEGRTLRRLWVKSFKKVNDTWMIKDLEVQQVDTGHRTKLVILDVNGTST
jgi:hypothetical protein